MTKYLLFLLLIPQLLFAQEPVKSVISEDYLLLIKQDSLNKTLTKKADSIKSWQLKRAYFYRLPVERIKFSNGQFAIVPLTKKYIDFGGTFTSAIAVKSINAMPALQNQYAQGQSVGGVPTWLGPQTGEVFSYGPLVQSLEYDGQPYAFDVNGRLVGSGLGNGASAIAYDNGIFQNGFLHSQSLTIRVSQGSTYGNKRWNVALKAGTGREGTVIRDNVNSSNNLSVNFETVMNKVSVAGGYSIFHSRFDNENRGGFLNRVYQNSLLTPITFDNRQGSLISSGIQRSYGFNTDNPYFLLGDNGHFSKNTQQTGNLSAKLKINDLTIGASSTLEANDLLSDESLKIGTAFFNNGFPLTREKNDSRLLLDGYANIIIRYWEGYFRSNAKVGYTRTQAETDILYRPLNSAYDYDRSVNEFLFVYQTTYDRRGIRAVLNVGNKSYRSSTFTKGAYFLPSIDGSFELTNIFKYANLPLKIAATYNEFYTEPSPAISYSYYALTQLRPETAYGFLPITEAKGFAQLQPVKNREFTSKLEFSSSYFLQFVASYFLRNSSNEVFPVNEGANIALKNLADVRFKGFELELIQRTKWSRYFNLSHALSFYKWTNKVKSIASGYAYTPIAGFSNINKALVEGHPVGVLVGNSYLKDQNGNTVIGNDGFPLVNSTPSVIGNPIPDFTIKLSQNLSFKERFSISIDWEYKKGGDVWNGTRALLDYYGRSEGSAITRNTTGYIFDGVNTSGQVNTIPVSFYDPSLPIAQSKWVRYGPSGVASDYIEKADALRLRNVAVTYSIPVKKIAQRIRITAYARNFVIWTAYQGADPDQLLYDQANAQGLDFFNLPSTKTFGLNVSFQF